MEKGCELSRKQMEQSTGGEYQYDMAGGIAGPGEKIIRCSNCTIPIYASIDKHIVKCPHCGAYTEY